MVPLSPFYLFIDLDPASNCGAHTLAFNPHNHHSEIDGLKGNEPPQVI